MNNPTARRPAKQRRGFTMLEMMCAVTVSSVLMVICVAWIHQTLKYSTRVTELKQFDETLNRLSTSLRHDVRSCDSMELDGGELTLKYFDGKSTIYAIEGNDLLVESTETGSPIKRESYTLPDRSMVHWDDSEMPDFIGLLVTRQLEPIAKPKLKEATATETKSDTPYSNQIDVESPIDLHVRVGANRWSAKAGKKSEGAIEAAKDEIEEAKDEIEEGKDEIEEIKDKAEEKDTQPKTPALPEVDANKGGS